MLIRSFSLMFFFLCFSFVQSMIVPEAISMLPKQIYQLSDLSAKIYGASKENCQGFELFSSKDPTDIAGGVVKLEDEVCGVAPTIAVVFHGVRLEEILRSFSEGTIKEGDTSLINLHTVLQLLKDSGTISDFNVLDIFSKEKVLGTASVYLPFLPKEAKIHPGFVRLLLNSYENMNNAISKVCNENKFIQKNTQIIFTGHSLGGALATLGALKYSLDNEIHKASNLVKVVSFCAPNLGNHDFHNFFYENFNDANIIRVYTESDIISHLPPFFNSLGRDFRIDRGKNGKFLDAIFWILEELFKGKKINTGVNVFKDVVIYKKQLVTPDVIEDVTEGFQALLDFKRDLEFIIKILKNPEKREKELARIQNFHKEFSNEEIEATYSKLKSEYWDLL